MIGNDNVFYNTHIAKYLKSVKAAIFFQALLRRDGVRKYEADLDEKYYGGRWMIFPVDECEEETCLSRGEQLKAIDLLIRKGFINAAAFGKPRRRHFQICKEEIDKLF